MGDRVITTRDVDEALGDVRGLDVYQIEQRGPEIEARLLPSLDEPLDTRAVRDALDSIGLSSARIREVDNLDPEPSGKIPLTVRARA